MNVFPGTRRNIKFQALEVSCIVGPLASEVIFCPAQFGVTEFEDLQFYVVVAASAWFAIVDLWCSVVITQYILSSAKPEQRERNRKNRLAEKLISLLVVIVLLDISAAVAFLVDKSTLLPLAIVFIHIIISMMLLQIVNLAITRSVEQDRGTTGNGLSSIALSRGDIELDSHHEGSGMWDAGE
jgi:L-asparagine transporter-like permease